eukprot:727637-Pelagomonas_calceolata.AAC.2
MQAVAFPECLWEHRPTSGTGHPQQKDAFTGRFKLLLSAQKSSLDVSYSLLHVAARKGSPHLLRLLLSFVGPGFVGLRDNSGETALDVARNHSHNDACWELAAVSQNQGRQGKLAWAAEHKHFRCEQNTPCRAIKASSKTTNTNYANADAQPDTY